jgi:hypothetical protein
VLPECHLPESYQGRAEELRHGLIQAELHENAPREFSVFGGAAILLWVNELMIRMTHDVDVYGDTPKKNTSTIEFHASPIENFLISPDWVDSRVDATQALGLKRWRLLLVYFVDLVTLKLDRWHDRDFEDALLLIHVFNIQPDIVAARLDEAWKGYATANRSQRFKVRSGFEELFDTQLPDTALPLWPKM